METTKISRRALLRTTAALTTAVVAAGAIDSADVDATREEAAVARDHDPATGEIRDRDRHHHWDTV